MNKSYLKTLKFSSASILALVLMSEAAQAASLFDNQGQSIADQRAHVISSQSVKVNRGALNQSTLEFNLDGEDVVAVRRRQIKGEKGNVTWIGHLQDSPANTVIFTARGNAFSGVIQSQRGTFELAGAQNGRQSLEKIDLSALPDEDNGMSDEMLSHVSPVTSSHDMLNDTIQQDIMVVYTQDACDQAANVSSGSDCSQLEADIVTTFAQMNQAYVDSDINIFSNLTSMRLLAGYTETSSLPITELRVNGDGIMDEVHVWREEDGADLVHMVQKNSGCGVAYTTIREDLGFAVTAEACMLGNRTFAHETGHNQNALHDRQQHSGGEIGGYRYGYRRCNNGNSEDQGAPYFRTVMAYSCGTTPRVGIFSNPNRSDFAGVPQGIDPNVDPNLGAYNARRINETAAAVSAYRSGTVTTPPAAPSGLSASANGADAINLTWTDNASDETGFAIERSTDNINFAEIASVGANVTSLVDNGLSAETTYFYRVEANNGAGASGYSNTASATTEALPTTIDQVANSETANRGTLSGTYTATHADAGAVQTITEVGSGGPKRRRQQSYSHVYNFSVVGGAGGVMLTANAWVSGSEGANFDYSVDGGSSWTSMFTVSSNSSANSQSFLFPGGTSGTVQVRVSDATQTNGEAVDSVSIDYLVITSNTVAGAPPAAPSSLAVAGTTSSSVSLTYTDNSSDEFGFEIWRSETVGACNGTMIGTANANQTSFTDNSASASTTYYYDVSAYNGGGSSLCAGEVSATTDVGAAITASGTGSKVKGAQQVTLSWSGATGTNVDIERNGSVVANVANTGSYIDPIGSKGGGSYDYRVCETGSTSACSDVFTIIF